MGAPSSVRSFDQHQRCQHLTVQKVVSRVALDRISPLRRGFSFLAEEGITLSPIQGWRRAYLRGIQPATITFLCILSLILLGAIFPCDRRKLELRLMIAWGSSWGRNANPGAADFSALATSRASASRA